MKPLFVLLSGLLSAVPSYSSPMGLPQVVEKICSQTVEVFQGPYGDEFSVASVQMDSRGDRHLIAAAIPGGISVSFLENGVERKFSLPAFRFSRVLLSDSTAWFLSHDRIREVSLSEEKILGEYPSYPSPIDYDLSTSARGFFYHEGLIYIAHGELGVVVFDARSRKHLSVHSASLQPGSLAAAVAVNGKDLFVLQGAYHPDGFNGISIENLSTGSVRTVAYSLQSGAVDPYSSSLKIEGDRLFVNNGGWIHLFSVAQLRAGAAKQSPRWLPLSEKISSAHGVVEKYLMINGDFTTTQSEVLACSSVTYVPVGARRPTVEWRMIQLKY